MRKPVLTNVFMGLFAVCFVQGVTAATVDISLDVEDWTRETGYSPQEPYSTMANTSEGNLRATTNINRGGTGYAIDSWTVNTYDFQNATLQFQWKVNSTYNAYSATVSGLQEPTLYGKNMSTHNSWLNSQVIANDTWLYTEMSFTETGYTYSISYLGYGQTDFLSGNAIYSTATWDDLSDARLWFRYVDVYRAGSYFELAEAQVIQPNNEPVPEPSTMLLFGTGLISLIGWRRNARNN